MAVRVEKLLSSLHVDSDDVRMIGIKGMGGSGKTTLARAVFDHISTRFEGKSFVEDVRERSVGSGLQELQKQVLTSVFNDQNIDVPGVSDGIRMIKKRMHSRKVLVVLDDVDNVKQLEALAGKPTWFKTGSRIIFTTRDEQVLVAHGVQSDNIHDVNMLSDKEAICLLSRHAFRRESPIQGYEELSKRVVSYAAGLPLTIKLVGSFLCGRPMDEWEDTIGRLKTIPWHDTLKRLEISYDGLEDDHKQIFLHVACLLKGKTEMEAIRALESCGFYARIGLRVLEQKSLITILHNTRVALHDHIEEMGMNIVRRLHPDEPNRHIILWKKDEIEDILVNELGTEAIRSVQLLDTGLHQAKILQGLKKMRNLRFLYITNALKRGGYTIDDADGYLPDTLRFLHWLGYCSRYLPKTFQAGNLVHLEMPWSNIHQLWEGEERKVLPKLTYLNLSESKLETFDVGITPKLKVLVLKYCHRLVELNATAECPHLTEIYLSNCQAFERLNVSNKCLHLERLDLSSCWAFKELQMHVEFPKLKSLNFSLSGITNLNLGVTPNLEELDLRKCNHFVELHVPVECPKLKTLFLGGFKVSDFKPGLASILRKKLQNLNTFSLWIRDIEYLPDSICMLKHLKFLQLDSCTNLKLLPEDLARLECLEELYLIDCSSLQEIPNSICKLKCLRRLDVSHCKRLQRLPDDFGCLESLEWLRVAGVDIENLSQSISQLKGLTVSTEVMPIKFRRSGLHFFINHFIREQ